MRAQLNEEQWECVSRYCRDLDNGIGIIHGAFGTGKTRVVSTIASAIAQTGRKTLIVCSSNSAADAVVDKFANSEHMVVRAHVLSLERQYFLSRGEPLTKTAITETIPIVKY